MATGEKWKALGCPLIDRCSCEGRPITCERFTHLSDVLADEDVVGIDLKITGVSLELLFMLNTSSDDAINQFSFWIAHKDLAAEEVLPCRYSGSGSCSVSILPSDKRSSQRPDCRVLNGSAWKDFPLITTLRRYVHSARTLSWTSYEGGSLRCAAERLNVTRKLINTVRDEALSWTVIRWEYQCVWHGTMQNQRQSLSLFV